MFLTGGRKPQRYQTQIEGGFDAPATLAGTLQLDDRSGNVQLLDGGAADREVRMPASNRSGVPIEVVNVGATNNLQLKDSTGTDIAGATAVLTPGQSALCVFVGIAWRHTGIRTIVL